ncbi:MAG: DUF2079 domain-containing protein [Parcubacteria group bacterium]|nr:DUF2079 domain-containing protein [Parcubacteria group bacterium]
MDKIKHYKILKFIPLLFLILLIWTPKVGVLIAGTAAHPTIAAIRYFCIPLIGLCIGSVVFLWIRKVDLKLDRLKSFARRYNMYILLFLSAMFFLIFSSLSILKYLTLHTCSGELGWYDNKVWKISQASSFLDALVIASTDYFQPLLIVYGFLYKAWDSPIFLQFLQTGAVVFGVIPLYLIAKDKLHEKLWIISIVFLYLLYPPVEYNATMEFHPDHVCIPLFLWAFYFVEKGRYWQAVVMVGLGGLAKEPLLLNAAFFGLYILLAKGRWKIGISTFVFYLIMFSLIIFVVQPGLTPYYQKLGSVVHGSNFGYLVPTNSDGIVGYLSKVIHGALTWKSRKVLLVVMLLAPFLCIPLIKGLKFIPALPSLFIAMLSLFPVHSAFDGQYTSAIIPSIFVGLIFALSWIRRKWGERYFTALFLWIVFMAITLNIAHSPSPLSPNFWDKRWSELYNHNVYKKAVRFDDMREIIARVPSDPAVKVVSQYNINTARLSHRIDYWIFPAGWKDADYILLDTWDPVIAIEVKQTPKKIYATEKFLTAKQIYEKRYREILYEILGSKKFSIAVEKNGIILLVRNKS